MGALPRRKITRQQRGHRRQHLALTAPSLSTCPSCGEYRRPHRVCLNCGKYKGRQYLKKDAVEE